MAPNKKWPKAQEVCYKELLTAITDKIPVLGTGCRTTAVTKGHLELTGLCLNNKSTGR